MICSIPVGSLDFSRVFQARYHDIRPVDPQNGLSPNIFEKAFGYSKKFLTSLRNRQHTERDDLKQKLQPVPENESKDPMELVNQEDDFSGSLTGESARKYFGSEVKSLVTANLEKRLDQFNFLREGFKFNIDLASYGNRSEPPSSPPIVYGLIAKDINIPKSTASEESRNALDPKTFDQIGNVEVVWGVGPKKASDINQIKFKRSPQTPNSEGFSLLDHLPRPAFTGSILPVFDFEKTADIEPGSLITIDQVDGLYQLQRWQLGDEERLTHNFNYQLNGFEFGRSYSESFDPQESTLRIFLSRSYITLIDKEVEKRYVSELTFPQNDIFLNFSYAVDHGWQPDLPLYLYRAQFAAEVSLLF